MSTTTPSGAKRVGAHGYVQATFLTGYKDTIAIYDNYRAGWREAGRGHDVPINRLAYACLLYVGDTRGAGAFRRREADVVHHRQQGAAPLAISARLHAGFC